MLRLLLWPVRAVDRLTDRIIAIVGALSLSQFPGYLEHYRQRLGGHLTEAKLNLESWREVAQRANVDDVPALVRTYLASPKVEVLEVGRKCAADIRRVEDLQQALTAMTRASTWEQPFQFINHLDPAVAQAALGDFSPNLPLTLTALVYALAGVLLASLLYSLLKRATCASARGLCRACRRRKRHDTPAAAAVTSAASQAGTD